MRRPLAVLVALALALAAGAARADDPPPVAPNPPPNPVPPERTPPKPTRLAPPPEIPGVHWERDFKEALRRAAVEGRPIFIAVNALEDQPGGKFPTKEDGAATRPYVCFVANGEDHGTKKWPDGTEVCSLYGTGTCACHKEALTFALAKFSSDGQTIVSPSHGILDPDGEIVFHGDFIQSAPGPAQFDEIVARVSPRLMMRAVWTARDDRMTSLSKGSAEGLSKGTTDWIGSGDALAPVGLVALLEQESDPARRDAIAQALRGAGTRAGSVLFERVDAATGKPDADPAEALRCVQLAAAVDPDLGAYAVSRVIARARDPGLAGRAMAWATGVPEGQPVDIAGLKDPLKTRVAEAYALRGDKGSTTELEHAPMGVIAVARVTRALRRAGIVRDTPPLGPSIRAYSRDELRSALIAASAAKIAASKDSLAPLLEDPVFEVRVAAAIALRRTGDPTGTEILLVALADPIEGPETHEALVAIAGKDLGDEAAAWEGWLREGKAGAK